mgnify:CR=1 FL=1
MLGLMLHAKARDLILHKNYAEALEAPPVDLNIVDDDRLAKGLMDRGLLSKTATPEQIAKAVKSYVSAKSSKPTLSTI